MNNNIETLYIPDEGDCRTCNICVRHCPTFKVKQQPEESPRGRLKLISKVLHDGEALSGQDVMHLNNCVECRACEKACPSKMRYLKLLGKTRDKFTALPVPTVVRGLLYLTHHHTRLLRLFSGLRFYQKSGLQQMAKSLGLLKLTRTETLNDMLPKLPKYKPVGNFYPATTVRRGAVGLFTGCLTDALDNPTLHAAIKVINRLGYDIHVPQQQQCCGAIHKHNGDKATADEMAEINLRSFKDLDIEAIIFTASACGSPLKQYKRRKVSDEMKTEIESFSAKLKEINEFISAQDWPKSINLKPLHKRVAVHEPCSQRFPLAVNDKPYEFLKRIPGIDLIPLAENNICCGAGGTYMLTHPEMSHKIRAEKLKNIQDSDAEIVATSNIGCAVHLATGIYQQKMDIVIAHPVELLSQQLD